MSRNVGPRHALAATANWAQWMFPKLAVTAIAMLPLSQTAAAESGACRSRSEIMAYLSRAHGELPKTVGLTDAGNLIEVLATNDGSTWSIIVTTPNGMSCPVATGEDWQELREKAADIFFPRE